MESVVLVFLLGCLVNFLLILAVRQMHTNESTILRLVLASTLCALGGVLLLRLSLKGYLNLIFGCGVILLSGMTAFGWHLASFRCCAMFLLLRLAVAGALDPLAILQPWPLLLASMLLLFLCVADIQGVFGNLIPIELSYGTNHIALTALRDTGNTLRDPVSGRPVLILGADAAENLTGLTINQLRNPVDTMGTLPGLRLIPYHTINGGGMLLALQLPKVCVGGRCRSALVAFAPEILSKEGRFQALAGGII